MAEWLGKALQKLLQQFESVWYLPSQPEGRFVQGGGLLLFLQRMNVEKQEGFAVKNDPLQPATQAANRQKWVGVAACIVLIVSCFMHWAYYPDLQKFFTGFDTKTFLPSRGRVVNYYGRPGILLCIFAGISILLHLLSKIGAKRANLFFSALCLAYAIKSFFMFSAAYSGIVPQKEAGIWVMLGAAVVNLVIAAVGKV